VFRPRRCSRRLPRHPSFQAASALAIVSTFPLVHLLPMACAGGFGRRKDPVRQDPVRKKAARPDIG
jgi:hypothetical protein